MKKAISIISILFIIILGLSTYLKLKKPEKPSGCIETTGIVEATEVGLGPKIAGRIDWLCCKEGDAVKAGELAVRLDDKELKARVLQGRKSLKAEEASLNISEANLENARLEIDAVRAEVQTAEAEVARTNALTEDAKKSLQRVSGLFKDGLISEREMDAAKTNYDANNAQLDSVRARKRAADVKLKISLSSIRTSEAQVSSARAKVEESQAALNVLEAQLKDTEIISPIDGVVAYKAFETGEVVNAGSSVYTIHDLKNIWARVDIEETKIGDLRLGNTAKITASAMPDKEFSGEIIEIGREGEFATQRDVTRGRSDIRTFRVKIGISKPDGLLKSGMTVRARIFCR
ncbi:MAG TPA: efflux RND transporter periplasmic adaptor subunit [Thermodesulfobacteriota bacterium]|nr:efflux RND transporter periplasmic adaptor subunit [Thermodesulfobacteriota bacterium]